MMVGSKIRSSLNRRQLLRRAGGVAGTSAAVLLLQACGGTASSGGVPTSAAPASKATTAAQFLLSSGATLYNDDESKFTLNSPEGVKALEWLLALELTEKVAAPGTAARQSADASTMFKGRKVASQPAEGIGLVQPDLKDKFEWYWVRPPHLPNGKAAVMSLPPEWIPKNLTFDNFGEALLGYPVLRWTLNSTIMAGAVTIAQLVFSAMAGYGFSKKRFRGRDLVFWIYISSMMVPGFALLVPLYTMMAHFGFVNTYVGLIAPGLSAPFGAFLMRQFIQTLPTELTDAARIDGCSELGVFWRIIIPLSKPGLAVLGIFVFMAQWQAFLWPLVVTSTADMRTLVVGFAVAQSAQSELHTNYGATMAASTYMAIPMLIVFFAFQRYFLRGITIGALKG